MHNKMLAVATGGGLLLLCVTTATPVIALQPDKVDSATLHRHRTNAE